MPFVPAANTAMAELRYQWNEQQVENTLYFEASASLSLTLMETLANDLSAWWQAGLRAQQVPDLQLREIFITNLTTNTSPTFSLTDGLPLSGGKLGDGVPNNCALCVSFRTGGRGRSARGRNYVPGLEDGSVTGSVVNGSYAAAILAPYSDLIGAGALTSGLQWCVVSRFSGGVARTAALIQPITSVLLVDDVIDSQRRRLPGRGR